MADTKQLLIEMVLENDKLKKELKETQKGFDKTKKKSKGMKDGLKSLQVGFVAAAAALAGTVAMIKKFVAAAAKQEQADKKMAQSLANVGDASVQTFRKMKGLASEIQRLTVVGDEDAQALISQALNLGITTDQMEQATKGAIGLGKALNLDTNTAMRATALALQGDFTMLQRYVPALRQTQDESEKMAIVQELMNNGFKLAQAETETMAGKMEQAKNAIGDLQEVIGAQLFEGLKDSTDKMTEFAQSADGVTAAEKAGQSLALVMLALKTIINNLTLPLRGLGLIGATAFKLVRLGADRLLERMDFVRKAVDFVSNGFKSFGEKAADFFGKANDKADEFTDNLKDKEFASVLDELKGGFEGLGTSVAFNYEELFRGLGKLFTKTKDSALEATGGIVAGVQTAKDATVDGAEAQANAVNEAELKKQAAIESTKTLALSAWETMQQFADMTTERRLQNIDVESEALQSQIDQGLISEAEGLAQQKELDKKKADIQRKAFLRNKAVNVTESIISGITSVAKAAANPPGPPLNIPIQIATGVAAAARTAAIAAQPVPKFARGGVINSVIGANIPGEDGLIGVQRGESILNKSATAELGADAVRALNEGRSIAPNVVINVSGGNPNDITDALNDYFRQFGTSAQGVAI